MMYLTGFVLALICTLIFCLIAILFKWVIGNIGVIFFAIVLLTVSLSFLNANGDKYED